LPERRTGGGMTSLPTTLFDRRSTQTVPATFRFGLTAADVLAVEAG